MSKKDTVLQTVVVAFILCIVCSVIVASTAVSLRSQQQANKLLDRNKNILAAAGLAQEGQSSAEITELFQQFEVRIVDLDSGRFLTEAELESAGINPATYDARKAAGDPAFSEKLSSGEDLAKIGRRVKFATVYLLREGEQIKKVVLPVHGYGLWGTLWGFLALEGDGNSVVGLGFYEHKETPGLGAKVDTVQWKSQWPGKKIYDQNGEVAVKLMKGKKDQHTVDALSGATLTTRGVENLIHFWMGPQGYAPFVANLKGGQL